MAAGKSGSIQVGGLSDIGAYRSVNQDAYLFRVAKMGSEWAGLLAVADGVGGLKAGEIASALAIQQLSHWWDADFPNLYTRIEALMASLSQKIVRINQLILDYSESHHLRTATTLSVLLLYKQHWYVFHIGDSRVYSLTRRALRTALWEQLTVDHSKELIVEEAGHLVKRSFLTACLGQGQSLNPYLSSGPLKPGQSFIVCSDGLYKSLSDTHLKKMIQGPKTDLNQLSARLIHEAIQAGEKDNITVLLAQIEG